MAKTNMISHCHFMANTDSGISIMSISTTPTARAAINLIISRRVFLLRAASAIAVGSVAWSAPGTPPAPAFAPTVTTSSYPALLTTSASSVGVAAPGR